MLVQNQVSNPALRLQNRPAGPQGQPSDPDSVELGNNEEKPPFLNSGTLFRAAKWGVIGAAAGALPFILGAKAGGIAASFAAGRVVDVLADNRETLTSQIAWMGVGAALTVAAGVGGVYIGALNDGFALNQVILGAATLGAYTTALSLAADGIAHSRS